MLQSNKAYFYFFLDSGQVPPHPPYRALFSHFELPFVHERKRSGVYHPCVSSVSRLSVAPGSSHSIFELQRVCRRMQPVCREFDALVGSRPFGLNVGIITSQPRASLRVRGEAGIISFLHPFPLALSSLFNTTNTRVIVGCTLALCLATVYPNGSVALYR